MKISNEKVFCLVEGEAAIYSKMEKEYSSPKYSYEELLTEISNFISQSTSESRLSMRDIWVKVAIFFDCEKFSPHFSKKSLKPNYNSFESRFSRDVTKILDLYYKRGLSPEQLKEKKIFIAKKQIERKFKGLY